MKNLYIVNTPFHLLTAFFLTKVYGEDEHYLALVHPHGYEKWSNSEVLAYLSSAKAGYKAVFPLINFLSSRKKNAGSFKEQVKELRLSLGALKIDRIFLGSDIYPQNQLLVAALGHEQFHRFEDGLYSYYNANRRRSKSKEIFHRWQLRWAMFKAGIESNLFLNTSTAGDSPAGIMDFMYKPELLQRYTPKGVAIPKTSIQKGLEELGKIYCSPIKGEFILYLSQPLVEKGLITKEEEAEFLQVFQASLPGVKLVYKAHPNDSTEKVDYMKGQLPQLEFWPTHLPAELILALEENLKGVISYESTALMYGDIFSKRPILAVSLSDCAGHPMYEKYKEIMVKAGVKFPANVEALHNLWQDFQSNLRD